MDDTVAKQAIPVVENRFIDRIISDPKETNRSPIEGYQDMLVLTLEEAVAKIIPILPQVIDYVTTAKQECMKPWFAFLKLFITALKKLPSVSDVFWRGVSHDVASEYTDNNVQIWWSVNSCSRQLPVVRLFLNTNGTLFSIQAMEGKDISSYSAFEIEQEVILMPGTRLRVKSKLDNFDNVLSIVHLEEQKNESMMDMLR
jgi:hypothetical protein